MNEHNQSVAVFAMHCLAASAAVNYRHWTTSNQATHEALGYFYTELPKVLDTFVEAFIGKTLANLPETIPTAPNVSGPPESIIRDIASHAQQLRANLAGADDLQAILDDVGAVCNRSIFLLRLN